MAEPFKGRNQDRKEFKIVGQRGLPGRQSYAMATGLAKFPRDYNLPEMLFAKFLRSPYGRARIKSMDVSKAAALPGVKAVVRWDDPEVKALPTMETFYQAGSFGTFPVLNDLAHREGEEVGAVVAADTEEICDAALKLIAVEWEILPHVIDVQDALKPDAPILHANFKGNVFSIEQWEVGSVTEGFKQADEIIEFDTHTTRNGAHHPTPETALAYWEQDHTGTQGRTVVVDTPRYVSQIGSQYVAVKGLGLPVDKVHALTPYWGGHHCAVMPFRAQLMAPFLAKRTGRPVRIAYTRRDDFDTTGNSQYSHVKIGFKRDGTMTAADGQLAADFGVPTGSVMQGVPKMSSFTYITKCPNVREERKLVCTSTGRTTHIGSGAGPNNEFINQAVTLIADKLGMDPTDVALKNYKVLLPSLTACIEKGKAAVGWKYHAPGTKTLANGKLHGSSFRVQQSRGWGFTTYNVSLVLREDGKVYMPYEEAVFGTFWADAMAMVIAEEVGAKLEDVIALYVPGLEAYLPGTASDHGPSGSWAAKEAAIDLKTRLLAVAAGTFKVKPDELDTKDSTVYLKADPSKTFPFKKFGDTANYAGVAAGFVGQPPILANDPILVNTQFCDVEVDPETGEVEVTKLVMINDTGKAIRPSSVEGQMEQCMTWGVGFVKFEELVWDKQTGVMLNGSSLDYKPPTILDIPPLGVELVETRMGGGCYGATGATHSFLERASIQLAVYNAIGKWIADIPITPDKVLKALGKI
jgi:CO/xanthine dehydrogenase Mo-binding subunit